MKTPEFRLIGAQATSIAQYGYRLIDSVEFDGESDHQKLKRLVLAKIFETLRDVGSVINKVDIVGENYVENVTDVCKRYFLLFALFFPLNCNSTVWTIGHVVPFHAKEIFETYSVGYGILSMQGKESKHSSLKQELKSCSNRSTVQDKNGKWYQLMRSSYVRNFYLPFHFPIPSTYHSHYQPRKPITENECCHCSRELESELLCKVCIASIPILDCVAKKCLTEEIFCLMMPVKCNECNERFADVVSCTEHKTNIHHNSNSLIPIVPRTLTVLQLKEELRSRKKSVGGSKEDLIRRLEGLL